MLHSLRTRLWLTYAILVLSVLCIVAFGVLIYLAQNPIRSLGPRLQDAADRLAQRADLLKESPAGQIRVAVQLTSRLTGFRVVVLGAKGQVLADSEGEGSSPLPQNLSLDDKRRTREYRDAAGQAWFYTTRSLESGATLVLSSPVPVSPVRQIFRQDIVPPIFIAGIVALLLALFLAFWISQWVAAPLQRLAKAAHLVANGQHHPIHLEGPLEVQEFASAFNQMSAQVQASQQAQRDLVANVSHELKTPLTSIQGFAQAILDGAADDPRQAASVIYDEAGRMHRLVLDLLELARLDAGIAQFRHESVDVTQLLQNLVDRLTPQADQARVELGYQKNPLPLIQADGDRLTQVFTNLIENAVKFTPAGGRVTINSRATPQSVEITIADRGPGIPPEDLPRIFERFYQTDKARTGGARRGVGLGLAIASDIVKAHSGSLVAQNSPTGGSVFMVKLPLTRPDDTTILKKRKTG